MNRRDFLLGTTAAAATTYAWDPLALAAQEKQGSELVSVLAPAHAEGMFDVARNRLAFQSGSADDDHAAHLVTDGSDLTFWESPAGEQWISVDLGKTFPLSRIHVQWGATRAASYRIEVSTDNDAEQWRPLSVAETRVSGNIEQIALKEVSARHIRLTGQSSADHGFSIMQLQAWTHEKGRSAAVARPTVTRAGALLTTGWMLQSSLFTRSSAERIASADNMAVDWMPAVVPGTVLTSYRQNGSIPDPWFGNQIAQISDGFFSRNDFWYRNSFEIAPDCKGRRLWLVFEGINWKADVFFNGRRLGAIEGAFLRARFDITDAAVCGGLNCVAVLIHAVAHPGKVQHKVLGESYRNGGVLGLDSPTFVSSIGWNWLPTIPGREIGIWNDVRFETTGDVLLEDPWVSTNLPEGDAGPADLTVHADLRNASNEEKHCTLALSMEGLAIEQAVTLGPLEQRTLRLDKALHAALSIARPRLWWPNGYGEPALHTLNIEVRVGSQVSDGQSVTFGIRTTAYEVEDGVLHILVNGHRIQCCGGNWGMDDGMLACDAKGYDLRVGMHRDMHFNMIRNWVGMVGRAAFYEACDRHGIMVWDDFWLANPTDGPDPLDQPMFMRNVVDKVRRVRRHASVAVYCGRNEGDPPAELDAGMRQATSELDGTRYYLPASASGVVTGHGPYDNQDPQWYFEQRGRTFHTEQGIVCVPPVESMRAMMPEKDLWPISDMWAVHDYQEPRSRLNTERLAQRYGTPSGIEDYCRKAQMVNLETAKAMFECLRSNGGSAQLVWMSQAAWPALICQLYDYSFEQTAAYFGVKSACEPVHILWDSFIGVVKVANNTLTALGNVQAEASIHGLDGKVLWHRTVEVSVPANKAQECFALQVPPNVGEMFLVKLRLRVGDRVVSENFYWNPAKDCTALNRLSPVALAVSAARSVRGNENAITATVSNPSAEAALAVRLKLVRGESGERVLPSMYEDNYFSLLPGEQKVVGIQFSEAALAGQLPRIHLTGWNVVESVHPLQL